MKIKDLIKYDSSFKAVDNGLDELEITGLTDTHALQKGKLVFIKNLKFLGKIENYLIAKEPTLSLVIDEKFWKRALDDQDLLVKLRAAFLGIFTVGNIDLAMSKLSKPFYDLKMSKINDVVDGRQMGEADIHPTAWIAQNVFIGENVTIGENVKVFPGSVILSEVQIGANTLIYPNVTLYSFTSLGENCRIHAGTTIGADGFGYNFDSGIHHKVWHMGGVIVENDVEIGANSCVDMGTFSPTVIGSGSKIDNHVQIAHNVRLGKGVIICGHSAVSGSAILGDFTVLGGKSGVGPANTLGKGVQVAGGALVGCDWPDGSVVGGHPARNLKEWMKGLAFVRRESLKK